MGGIDPKVITYRLNIDPSFYLKKQKRRKLETDRNNAVNKEVNRLLENAIIQEVQYPNWLANPVVVRVCIDFTDLNKACLKDSFPLTHIDQMVDATTGHEMLSLLDAFSSYNQI